jgi:hypothetical protein
MTKTIWVVITMQNNTSTVVMTNSATMGSVMVEAVVMRIPTEARTRDTLSQPSLFHIFSRLFLFDAKIERYGLVG